MVHCAVHFILPRISRLTSIRLFGKSGLDGDDLVAKSSSRTVREVQNICYRPVYCVGSGAS